MPRFNECWFFAHPYTIPVFLSSRTGHNRYNWHVISFDGVYISNSRYGLTRLVLYELFIDILSILNLLFLL